MTIHDLLREQCQSRKFPLYIGAAGVATICELSCSKVFSGFQFSASTSGARGAASNAAITVSISKFLAVQASASGLRPPQQ